MGNQFKNVAVIACLKTLLFIFNIVFWLTGLFLLLVGLWAELDLYKYLELSPEFSGTAPHVLIGIAGLIILISSIAFSCIIKGQPVLLYILACCGVSNYTDWIRLSPQHVIPTSCCVDPNDCVTANYSHLACCGVSDYTDWIRLSPQHVIPTSCCVDPNDCVTANYSHLACCGVSDYTDWIRLSPQHVIPTSCCVDPNDCVTANYSHGCYEVITEYLRSNMDVLIGIAIGTALLPLLGTILSCSLASYIKKSKYDVMN
ncbi:Tetraspanin [Operophtera brumata]|uniref:Tetraspanin n=1 Tax=Operophtera brumata TaxID=104452 RepID=A0A0L7L883_OPEBR|nr:Tetraspanin [Operophtera brumata]